MKNLLISNILNYLHTTVLLLKKSKTLDFFIVIVLIFIGCIYSYLTKDLFIGRSLFSGIALMFPASLYMGFKEKKNWRKIIIASCIFGSLFGFCLSFYAEVNKSWNTYNYIFPFRLFGVIALEDIIGQGFMALLTFTFYEHFLDREKSIINKKVTLALLVGFMGVILLLFLYTISPSSISHVHYAYSVVGVVAIIPLIYIIIRKQTLIPKLCILSIFFFFIWFIFELIAITFGYWGYNGEYIGWVQLLNLKFPFEELLFWMLLYSPTIVVYYELTMDDGK